MGELTAKELKQFKKLQAKANAPMDIMSERELEEIESRATDQVQRNLDWLNAYTSVSTSFTERIFELERDNARLICQVRFLKTKLQNKTETEATPAGQ